MKYLVKFVILVVTWPFFLGGLLIMSFMWLCLYCWGVRDKTFMPTEELQSCAYCLWHFKTKTKTVP